MENKYFNTISPSAKSLLLMKGLTPLPFAKEAAILISEGENYTPTYEDKDLLFCLRTAHFEGRYLSINQLLEGLDIKNILELSSGFSFRGLAEVQEKDVYYIDTDLPDLIEQKKAMLEALKGKNFHQKGTLEVLPLNALDEGAFLGIVSKFPQGPLAIVNEGLLMYLEMDEKEKLASIIHKTLKERGGYWITADIYIRDKVLGENVEMKDNLEKFLQQHRVEEKKFESFEEAREFFDKCGFEVEKEAMIDYREMSAMPHVMKKITPEQLLGMSKSKMVHASWRLRVKE